MRPGPPRRVLYVLLDLGLGGAERQFLEIARRLDRRRFLPEVATIQAGGGLEGEYRSSGVPLHCFPRAWRWDPLPILRLARLVRRRGYAVVHTVLYLPNIYGTVAARLGGVSRCVASERATVTPDRASWGRVHLAVERLVLLGSRRITANCEAVRRYLLWKGHPARKIRVIYNGVDCAAPPGADRPEGPPRVGMFARFVPQKDQASLIGAFALLARVGVEARLVLRGVGPGRPAARDLARGLGVEARVEFPDGRPTTRADLASLDVAVLSSHAEGCSNFILEAMAAGLPVVASDVGGNRELVEHGVTGLLVPRRSPRRLAGALRRVLEDPEEGRRMGCAGRRRVQERFSMASAVAAHETLLEEVLAWR
ncbi:MAG: glycosyltransferase [Planctomycetes bacterium]|nr:glycosyltransferase [Planctomycetota bacterium]